MYEATWPNPAIRNDPGARRGIHHPYVGIAGKPTFTIQRLIIAPSNGGNMDEFHTAFFDPRLPVDDNIVEQRIVIANIGDNPKAAHLHSFEAGARLFIKDNDGRFYFPGETTATSVTIEPVRISTRRLSHLLPIGASWYCDTARNITAQLHALVRLHSIKGLRFHVRPGMQQKQPPIAIPHNQVITAGTLAGYLTSAKQGHFCGETTNLSGLITTSGNRNGAAGHVTTQAEIDPHVLLMRADVKYKLEVSYDG